MIDHAIDGKGIPDQPLAPCSQTPAQRVIPGQEEQAIVQTGAIAGGEQEARFTVEADFAGPIAVERDDGFAGGKGLGQGARQAFASREVHEHVHDPDMTRDLGGRNQARKHEVISQTHPAHTVFESPTPEAVSDQEKLEARACPHQIRGGGNQVVVPFQFEQARHFPDHDVVRGQSQAGAPRRIGFGGEVGTEVEPAQDAGVLGGPADAGGQVLVGHRVGNDDEVGGESSCMALCTAECSVGQRPLERAEGRAVNGMDDRGHPGPPRGQAPKDAGLAAVGVDDVRPALSEQGREFAKGAPVEPGMDRAHERGKPGQQAGLGSDQRFDRAFRAGRQAGDQSDIEARFAPQSEH